MPNRLVCNASSCANNSGSLCQSSKIEIQGIGADSKDETRCATYCKNSFTNNVKNVFSTNYTGILEQDLYSGAPVHPSVSCSAGNCEHNHGGQCSESDLQIYSSSEGVTMCRNFDD